MASCQGRHSIVDARGLGRNTPPDADPDPGAVSPGSVTPVREQDICLLLATKCPWVCDLHLQTCGLSPELPTQWPTVPTSSGPSGYCQG